MVGIGRLIAVALLLLAPAAGAVGGAVDLGPGLGDPHGTPSAGLPDPPAPNPPEPPAASAPPPPAPPTPATGPAPDLGGEAPPVEEPPDVDAGATPGVRPAIEALRPLVRDFLPAGIRPTFAAHCASHLPAVTVLEPLVNANVCVRAGFAGPARGPVHPRGTPGSDPGAAPRGAVPERFMGLAGDESGGASDAARLPRAPRASPDGALAAANALDVPVAGAAPWLLLGAAIGSAAVAWTLYRRLHRRAALDHPRRRAILDLLADAPGATAGGVARALGTDRRTALHHLAVLRDFGLAQAYRDGARVRYALPRGPAERRRAVLAAPAARRVHAAWHAQPRATVGELARAAGLPRSTTHWHLQRLRGAGAAPSPAQA